MHMPFYLFIYFLTFMYAFFFFFFETTFMSALDFSVKYNEI